MNYLQVPMFSNLWIVWDDNLKDDYIFKSRRAARDFKRNSILKLNLKGPVKATYETMSEEEL